MSRPSAPRPRRAVVSLEVSGRGADAILIERLVCGHALRVELGRRFHRTAPERACARCAGEPAEDPEGSLADALAGAAESLSGGASVGIERLAYPDGSTGFRATIEDRFELATAHGPSPEAALAGAVSRCRNRRRQRLAL